ncbi:sugar ABC transporter ATP-binding protein [Jiangella alba]|uniref:Monosaccharide ABC transporter ATP-binding protein, CUT2 family n=1 Tax=Jiangella alba TaxID=561176 RepID=A0A1H5PXN7_9ACTN|nr:sugar ABC transporter ATP-binding protein [Jiangella alba]SEF18632.1 monosaccharide ABC transporter ATP-binding protein, CUT2 family [Jiangella alba]
MTGVASPATTLLRMRGIEKSFLGVQVLHGVDLDLRAGEVHALIGENGAGKSTLMKILAGVYQADGGSVELDGEQVRFEHPLLAQQAGVSTVFQEFNLLPERTVAENVFLGREPRRNRLVDAGRMHADTAALLDDLGLTWLRPETRVSSLSVAGQQIVEIVKALSYDARIISMDEPTAALADEEVELLYRLVAKLKERGVAILYVSHRLKEIFDLSDRVTILKDGALVDTVATSDITSDELVRKMVGRPIASFFPDKLPGTEAGDVRLEIRGGGNEQLDGIDLDVRGGEIVALAGLQGSGRTEIAHALFGVDRFTRGTVRLDGRPLTARSPRQAVRAGLALVTEDRKGEGLVLNQSIAANARLVLDAVLPRRASQGARRIPGILSSLELVSRGSSQEVRFLSGGNQQKVVLAKWLATEPKAIVLDEPTRGIDVGAKERVYTLMRELSAQGVAILMISSELPEVLGMADRIVVLRDGRVAGELPAGADEETVMALATGHETEGTQR